MPDEPSSASIVAQARMEREARALRDNLRRRKQQRVDRAASPSPAVEPAVSPAEDRPAKA